MLPFSEDAILLPELLLTTDVMPSQARTRIQPPLPYDIWHDVSATVIGDYIDEVFSVPKRVKRHNWDGLGALLHLARVPRQCTVEHLYKLWGETFIDPDSMEITGNYKRAVALMCDLSFLAQYTLDTLHPSPLLSDPAHLHPSCPLVRLYKPLLLHIAHDSRGCIRYWGGESELVDVRGDGERGQCEGVLIGLLGVYAGMNKGVRYALVGKWVERWVGELVRSIRVAMLQHQVDTAWNVWLVCRTLGSSDMASLHISPTTPTPHEQSKLTFLASALAQCRALGFDITPFTTLFPSDARCVRNFGELVGAIVRHEAYLRGWQREGEGDPVAECWRAHCLDARTRLGVVLSGEEMRRFFPVERGA